jgi:predicted acylesterase/phospholipase RssA
MIFFLLFLSFFSTCLQARENKFALSSSGGVSLGNYQAGRLYYQNQLILENNSTVSPSVYTGASAGSINSLLSAIHLCGKKNMYPDKSIYWDVWNRIAFNKLTEDTTKENSASLFSDQILREIAQKLRIEWNKGIENGCVAYLGIPITLQRPDVIKLTPTLHVQRQLVTIMLKVTGQGDGKPPLVENIVDPSTTLPVSRLYLGDSSESNFDALISLLLASASFPGAFPPQFVRVCIGPGKSCHYESSQDLKFIDGGLYENQPIKLGYEIKKILHQIDPTNEPMHFRHVDASGQGYVEDESESDDGFVKTLTSTLSNFVNTSRNLELYSLIKQYPDSKSEISSTVSMIPKASEPWGAFMGFFDEGFREYDFLLGMYESYHEFLKFKKINLEKQELSFKIDDQEISHLASWRRFTCLKQYFDEEEKNWDKICHDPAMNNLLALSQVSLLRLFNFCKDLPDNKNEWPACNRFNKSNTPPVLSAKYRGKIKLPEKDQNSGSYLISSLEKLNYQFDASEFDPEHPINEQVRRKLQLLFDDMTVKQDKKIRRPLKNLGTSALDAYVYLPPKKLIYVTLGDVSEIGWMTRKLPWSNEYSRAYLNLALEFKSGNDLFKGTSKQLTFAPIIGFAYPLKSSGATFQYQTGLGIGYIQPMKNITETRECSNLQKVCDGLMLRPYFGVSIFKNVQINFFTRITEDEDQKMNIDFNIAAGLNYFY